MEWNVTNSYTAVCKEGHPDSRDITTDFLEGVTINSAPYCQLLRQYSPYLWNEARIFVYILQICLTIPHIEEYILITIL